ncbi:discoidin domain-containing protein [Nonomuraea sp. K274]|uniref:Discoidin domain-containing protein n=1 Tax=Nonomuraea cypriaca TaxID=1187855 RepID=A0A931A321_9ACTN|nr:discoidin domain-containing protein [Nonomuraea cypriaca]MBF8184168.1 discoidin domain-containing protein [Nonomuraea cypriaca]
MNRRWPAAALTMVISAATLVATAQPAAAALGTADFLKVSGSVLKKDSGAGATINLRGTNLGGWLTQEDWMSPLGEFALDRTGWTATASAGDAALALDGDDATRWTTSVPMNGGEWLRLDLGAMSRFDRVAVNHTEFAGDFPRGFKVDVSTDDSAWTTVFTGAGSGTGTVTTAGFSPVTARYVRVRQTGSAAGVWWSVGEVNVFNGAGSFDRTQWTASAPGGTASAVIDGDLGTRWTTGAGQVPGQWVQLDLGARMTINNVSLDTDRHVDETSNSPNDYPRGYTVQLSDDGSAWTQVAAGAGTYKATNISFPAASGRNAATRWNTGAAQTPGQWYQIDLGTPRTIAQVTVQTPATADQDYPRGFRLELSTDGGTWTTAATGIGFGWKRPIAVTPQTARFVRITQTGTAVQWWSIDEVTMYSSY